LVVLDKNYYQSELEKFSDGEQVTLFVSNRKKKEQKDKIDIIGGYTFHLSRQKLVKTICKHSMNTLKRCF